MPARALLVLLLVALQIADVATTNVALATPGLREGNPVMAWAQEALGAHWWVMKWVLAYAGICALALVRNVWPLRLATGYYATIVISNALHMPPL
ncbi:MAG: DUF5658 family protein [Acetobacteraceae bacterium]|nr:hypothetical protein [Pseudomonadota bacterium]